MIHYLKGTLRLKAEGLVVIEVGGIGYEVFVPAGSNLFLKEEGEAVTVFTSMQVREDDVSLYGFGDEQELFLFKKLITVNSVGAKAALAILSSMPPEEVRRAIIFEDVALLTRANGIGKKTAQKIVLDLKGKLGSLEGSGEPVTLEQRGSVSSGDEKSLAIEALVNLGYSLSEATSALLGITEDNLTVEDYIKLALKKI